MKYEVGDLVRYRAFGNLGTVWVVVGIEQTQNSTIKTLQLRAAFAKSDRVFAYDRDVFKINEK
jgi:hypothetical protein